MDAGSERTPLTLLTGFLGSGKTTLVNRILARPEAEPVAVIVNEFGDLSIDGSLVVGASEELVELANGCVCCTVRGDLQASLLDLLERRRRRMFKRARFERILVEASGLASPGPVAQTLVITPELESELRLDGIVTLAHAALLPSQLEEHPEAAEQVGYADHLILNHSDRCDDAMLEAARVAARSVNAHASMEVSERSDVDVEALLNLRTTDSSSWSLDAVAGAHGHDKDHEHAHAHSHVSSVGLRSSEPLDLYRLKMWLQLIAARREQPCLRLKGVFRCADHGPPVVVQAVHQWLELGPGEGEAPEESILVLIGQGLDAEELERGFRACRAGG